MTLIALVLSAARAGSVAAPGVVGGLEAGPATVGVAAIHWNPAALGALDGVHALGDVQFTRVHLEIEATRNGGIDPNTGEPYPVATSDLWVPVALVGVAARVWSDRLTLGAALSDPFTGGGDYTAQEDDPPPYTGHQRYHVIDSRLVAAQAALAAGLRLGWGAHLGGSLLVVRDALDTLLAADPLGNEGQGLLGGDPYSNDVIVGFSARGFHLGWGVGAFYDRYAWLQGGLSFQWSGTFQVEGEGTSTFPDSLGGVEVPTEVAYRMPLPPMVRVAVASQARDDLLLQAGAEFQLWSACCGGPEGDALATITSADGDPIGPADGVALEIPADLYAPRRLEDAVSAALSATWLVHPRADLTLRLGVNTPAVPDWAVSPVNLDFFNWGGGIQARVAAWGPVRVGLSYSKYFPAERTITDSAWDVRDPGDPAYVDDRFSPEFPYKSSANGTYRARSNTWGVRIQADW